MNTSIWRCFGSYLIAILFLFGTASWTQSQAKTPENGFKETRAVLVAAATAAEIRVTNEGMLSISQAGVSFVAASISGVEKIPPTAYAQGVNMAFVYLSGPNNWNLSGYYTVRMRADVMMAGKKVKGEMALVDRNRKVAARFPATFNVTSLTVPTGLTWEGNMITAQIEFENMEAGFRRPGLVISFWCTNGLHVVTIIR